MKTVHLTFIFLVSFSLFAVAQNVTGDTPPTTFKVAAVQVVSEMAKPAENRTHLQKLVRQAAGNGAKVVVLPETAITGYMSTDLKTTWQIESRKTTRGLSGMHPKTCAETIDGESVQQFSKLADELDIYLTIPFLEVDPNSGAFYNTLVLAEPDGTHTHHYRKLNPWPFAEQSWAAKGNRGHVYLDTPYGRMALLICFDINFEPPNLKKLGVDHLLYSIAWVDGENSDWFTNRLPAIARKNNLNIIGANWTVPEGSQPDWHGYGKSLVISRTGQVLNKVERDIGEQIIYADLSLVK